MPNSENPFPATKQEALAFLFVQSLDNLKDLPAEELARIYDESYKRISNKFREMGGKEPYFKNV